MSLQITGHRILIKPATATERLQDVVPEELKKKGFQIKVENEKRENAATELGVVLQIGPTAWRAFDGDSPHWQPWCKVGDTILFAKYAGKFVEDPDTEELFMVINDEDIQAIVTRKDIFEGELG